VDVEIDRQLKLMPSTRTLRAWYEYLKRRRRVQAWRAADWRSKAGWTRDYIQYWLKNVWQEAQAKSIEFGDYVASIHGISHRQQIIQQCWLHLRYNVPLHDYYIYELYREERWNRVSEHVPAFWMLQEELINRTSPGDKAICDDKVSFFEHCKRHTIPTVPVLGIIDDRGGRNLQGGPLTNPRMDVFIKPKQGYEGRCAHLLCYQHGRYANARASYESWGAALTSWTERLGSVEDFIVQPRISVHADWLPYTSGAVPTVRLVTYRTLSGGIAPLAAVLRMPVGDAITDNWATGGLAAIIDLSDGRLAEGVPKYVAEGAVSFTQHPDTGHTFAGELLSGWERVLKKALDAHGSLDMIFVGWDITRTPSGICFIEANKCWDPFTLIMAERYPLQDTKMARLYDRWMRRCS
jgi:hypothetical protein